MRFFFYIGLLFIMISCNENKAETRQVDSSVKTEAEDVVIVPDTVPVYREMMRKSLSDGFIFPIKYTSAGSAFNYRSYPDSVKYFQIASKISFNDRFSKPVEVAAPALGELRSFQKDSSGYSLFFKHQFHENGKIRQCEIVIHGCDSLTFDTASFHNSKKISQNEILGYIIPGNTNNRRTLYIAIRFGTDESCPFYSASVDEFFKEYKTCIVPSKLERCIFAHKSGYKMYYFEKGELKNEYVIGLSQSPIGHKQMQGDNKLPEGIYRITEKSRGPFYGDTGPWLGDAWMQFSYPNQYDAIHGYKNGTISLAEKNAIVTADRNKRSTNSYTNLGGRVGIHGWNGDWIADGTQNLTWGCITMLNKDINVFYEFVPIGTTIIIVP